MRATLAPRINRSRQQPAGLPDSRLPCHLVRPGDCSWRVCSKSSRREPGPKADRGSLQRSSGHRRRRRRSSFLPTRMASLPRTACASTLRCSARRCRSRCTSSRTDPTAWAWRRDPALSEWPALLTNWLRGEASQIARRRPISWSDHFGGGSRATLAPVLQLEIGASAVGRYRADPAPRPRSADG